MTDRGEKGPKSKWHLKEFKINKNPTIRVLTTNKHPQIKI
jgi:hypothetical protein